MFIIRTSNIAGITSRYLNDNYKYHRIGGDGFEYITSAYSETALRPVILIDQNVQIISGDGTFNDPYRI